ncbi:MAG: ribonuclease III [Clostridia bacterium]|nr:ribonuclease III [Clostridia bacterium]MBQ3664075.1 ribonuclease III [Clostridia bacterium]
MTDKQIKRIETDIGYTFHDPGLLITALTHSSYVLGDGRNQDYNERLEFLGDAVLELSVSRVLFDDPKRLKEGQMSRMRASIVCEKSLFAAAKSLSLQNHIILGHGEEINAGRSKPSVLSDAMEAVIGAIYLDGGYEAADAFIKKNILASVEWDEQALMDKDSKTKLQEFVQAGHLGTITYQLAGESGPDHDKIFTEALLLDGTEIGRGQGRSKQEAGRAAAETALRVLQSRQTGE